MRDRTLTELLEIESEIAYIIDARGQVHKSFTIVLNRGATIQRTAPAALVSPPSAEPVDCLDVETIASLLYEAQNTGMQWVSLYPSHNHLHATVRQRFIEAAARFQDLWPYRANPSFEASGLAEVLEPFAEAASMALISGRPPGEHVDANAFLRARDAFTSFRKGA